MVAFMRENLKIELDLDLGDIFMLMVPIIKDNGWQEKETELEDKLVQKEL